MSKSLVKAARRRRRGDGKKRPELAATRRPSSSDVLMETGLKAEIAVRHKGNHRGSTRWYRDLLASN